MSTLWWIVAGGVAMSAIALIGSVTLLLPPRVLERIITPLVALAAGSLLGGAFFHMLPAAAGAMGDARRRVPVDHGGLHDLPRARAVPALASLPPRRGRLPAALGYLILLGDGLHNFLGGLGVAGVFLIDVRLGIMAWIAAAAHEIPQELGDFGVLIHSGWSRRRALLFNFASGLTFLVGGLVAYGCRGSRQRRVPRALCRRELPLHRGVGPGPRGEPAPARRRERAWGAAEAAATMRRPWCPANVVATVRARGPATIRTLISGGAAGCRLRSEARGCCLLGAELILRLPTAASQSPGRAIRLRTVVAWRPVWAGAPRGSYAARACRGRPSGWYTR
jgi:zinc and cadmium transporter